MIPVIWTILINCNPIQHIPRRTLTLLRQEFKIHQNHLCLCNKKRRQLKRKLTSTLLTLALKLTLKVHFRL